MQYSFAELVDLPGFQQVMQSWYSVAGVATALLDPERNVLCAVGWQDVCTRFHHLPEEAEGRCPYSDIPFSVICTRARLRCVSASTGC